MAALTDRRRARARIAEQFQAELDRLIPPDENKPLQGQHFRDWEDQSEQIIQKVSTVFLQERAKLAELQDQWKSKLRQAEIDISVERAKITRDRAEIEDKLAAYEKERSKHAADGGSPDGPNGGAKKPTRGRWLARLGLKDGD